MNMNTNKNNILQLMIKFAFFEEECFPIIKDNFHENNYCIALNEYRNNYKRYIHRYLAIAHIYHSIINCATLFDVNTTLHLKGAFTVREKKLKHLTMAIHESFIQQLFIQYAKLYEALWDDEYESDNHNDMKSHQDSFNEYIIKNNLTKVYAPLLQLIKKIKESKIIELRNKMFAHPFKHTNKSLAYSPHQAVENIHESLEKLCDENDVPDFWKSERRIRYYVNRYLVKGERSKSHIRIIHEFMKTLRKKMFLNIDPYIYLERHEAMKMVAICINIKKGAIPSDIGHESGLLL